MMMMNEFDDDDLGFAQEPRGRACTWSHHGQQQRHSLNSLNSSRQSSYVSLEDYVANDQLQSPQQPNNSSMLLRSADNSPPSAALYDDAIGQLQQQQQTQLANGKKRRKSYTEIIATAILSSNEKRLTLAEIYDWMAANCEEYRNQRYVPSSSSWKNAVRHNLSVQSCFKRVKRHGVEKPSWWTVDVRQAAKRRLSIPLVSAINNNNNNKTALDSEIVQGPLKQRSQGATVSADSADDGVTNNGAPLSKGFYYDNGFGPADTDEINGEGEHAYSRNVPGTVGGHPNQMSLEPFIKYEHGQSVATLNLNGDSSIPISAEQLAQIWLNRFKTSNDGASGGGHFILGGKDGTTVQTLRVKTAQGVEQNVRFMGALRINVVVRCEKSCQTDDQSSNDLESIKEEDGIETIDYTGGYQDCQSLSRACSIDQTLINLGNDCDISKILHGDVRMPSSSMDVLSPTAIAAEEDALAACWNAIGGDDLMTLTNMS